jgi:GNAT superfamily N-acetyltransferase
VTLHHIQAHLRASTGPNPSRVGRFVLCYAPDTDNVFRNYAIPDDMVPTAAEVAALLDWFAAHQRRPRLEYVSPAPAEEALLAAGFTVERLLPLMVLSTLFAPPQPPDTVLRLAISDEDLYACVAVQNSAYSGGEPTEADLARLTSLVERGGVVALALVDGVPASSGLYTASRDGLAEVAAVGTREEYRRRGLAAAVVALLSGTARERGVTPYLQAESPREEALYSRLGYTTVGALALANGPLT